MHFPVVLQLFGLEIPAHLVFELLAYTLGFQLFLFFRRREKANAVTLEQMAWLLVGAVFGALFGSKLLAWLEHPAYYWSLRSDPQTLIAGKTIVGGLLGGWAGVEIAKKLLHIHTRTGDAYALPLIVGIAVGRVGCFLTGLADMTHGIATSLPWGIDFGDGVRRHPTQLYEIGFLMLLGVVVVARRHFFSPLAGGVRGEGEVRATDEPCAIASRRNPPSYGSGTGNTFRLFLAGYLLFRFAIEWIKPSPKSYTGLSAIQIASLIGTILCVIQMIRASRPASPAMSE